jgi:hypothetical protein
MLNVFTSVSHKVAITTPMRGTIAATAHGKSQGWFCQKGLVPNHEFGNLSAGRDK